MDGKKTPLSWAVPAIVVTFLYCDEGKEKRRFQAYCTAIPREGELVAPEAGSKRVIVHAVTYRIEQLDVGRMLVPVVFLRELTQEEEKKYCISTKE